MVDADAVILDELARLAPRANFADDGWADVLRRVNVRGTGSPPRSRRIIVALAMTTLVVIAVAVSPLGAAIGREVGNFSDWLTGHPGTPASSSAQKAFAQETRSWFDFPRHPALRSLIVSKSAGLRVTVYGFRSADALCLRLVASGPASSSDLACAPLGELRTRKQPALVMTSDYGVGIGRKALDGPLTVRVPQAAVTLGVVADGIKHVLIGRSDGSTAEATVRGDTFLSIAAHPAPELRVTHVWAELAGKRVAIPFVQSLTPLDFFTAGPSQGKPSGPTTVQRPLHTGAMAWFAHRQLRGRPVPPQLRRRGLLSGAAKVIFARMVAPDPQAPERVIISLFPAGHRFFSGRLRDDEQVCAEVVGGVFNAGRTGGGGCWPAGRLFSTGPFTESVSEGPNNQYVTISGVASDDVGRMRLYLANGTYVPIPLADNTYVVQASAAEYPLRLVGYDANGRIVGIRTLIGNRPLFLKDRPIGGAVWHTVLRNQAGAVMTAPSTEGHLCIAYSSPTGGASIGCFKPLAAHAMQISAAGENDRVTIFGTTGSAITHVIVGFRDGTSLKLTPTHGYVLALLHGKQFGSLEGATGVDAQGKALDVESWRH